MRNMMRNTLMAGNMREVCQLENGVVVVGAWGKDVGTMERRLKLAVVYPDGAISPLHEYQKRKLTSPKALSDLADLDGVAPQRVEEIFKAVMEKQRDLCVQTDGSGRCDMAQAYQALCEYVREYEEPGKVFIRDGYGNILATHLQSVIDRLELGLGRLELQKNFKAWGLLQTSERASHVYAYAINTGSANNWFFSFKLLDESEAA